MEYHLECGITIYFLFLKGQFFFLFLTFLMVAKNIINDIMKSDHKNNKINKFSYNKCIYSKSINQFSFVFLLYSKNSICNIKSSFTLFRLIYIIMKTSILCNRKIYFVTDIFIVDQLSKQLI